MTYTIEFEPVGIRLVCPEPLTIAEAARQVGICIQSVCGGKAVCGKCRVRVEALASGVSPVTLAEQQHLNAEQIAAGWRLACRTVVSSNTQVYVPATAESKEQVIQTEGLERRFTPTPAVQLVTRPVSPPSLDDQTADLERVARAFGRPLYADLPALQSLRSVLREGNWQVTLALRGDEIIAAFPGIQERCIGLAVDIGTTKLACYLVDLPTGQTVATTGVMNPQLAYGEDVMSRLEAVMVDPANAARLQHEVIQAINAAAAQLCALQGLAPENIVDVCLVGNTAMHHLLARLPVRPLALLPFVPALRSPLDVEADRLGLQAAPGARVHLPPPIAGFVGSDHLAFLLAADFGQDDRVRLGIDIGTNTEIALQANGRIVSCSTASGPAFEGAHIRHGMRAAPGAIERVHINGDGLPQCEVIGDVPATGICGSGVLDALAEMQRVNLVNLRGRMDTTAPRIQLEPDGMPFLTLARGSDGRRDVVITQHDVDQILLAKGAIRAGINILLDHCGLTVRDLAEVVIAGAFGCYLDPFNAVRIGLLPQVPLERIHAVGNAAGAGARLMLASTGYRRQAQALAARIEYLELTVVPGFSKYFAQGIRLPTQDVIQGGNTLWQMTNTKRSVRP